MNAFKTSKIVNKSELNICKLYQKQTPILAGNELLKIHRFFLNSLNQLCKTKSNQFISPFSLFSKSSALVNSFKITQPIPSELTDKISHLGNKKNPDHPMQDFIKSLSVQSTQQKNSKPASIQTISEKAHVSSPFSAEIIEVINENKDFKTLRIKRPKDWDFQPGQYLEIRAENSSATKPAILAIASGIDEEYIEITARPNNNPSHANYCLNSNVGDYLTITGPLGSNFPLHLITPDTPVLVLGGGSGMTALKSIMQSMPDGTDIKMIYSSKTYQELLYREEIEKWKAEGHIISLTQGQAEGYPQGRITEHLKNEQLRPHTLIFICGPKELVLETAKMLVELGIPRESIYGSLPTTAKEGGPVYRGDHPKMMS